MRLLAASVALVLAALFFESTAWAFCGFYVAGADAKLFAEATQVVLMREGTRTVLSMQNDYKGPLADFAMVVPVPVVLQKENVKTLPRDVFARVDRLAAPRLVEYWERDPCAKEPEGIGLGNIGTLGFGAGVGSGSGYGRGDLVKVEAQFEVGEYQIVILSAKDAAALDVWLADNGYKIPDGAEPLLRPYVQAGSKFFVAKVDVSKVKMEGGVATLSPLRFHYDSEKLELPVRLGLVSSSGKQDLVIHVLSPDKRYEVANYPNVTIPTNLDVAESARESFGEVYAALFDRTLEKTPGAVVTEYAWPASSCDPCPGGVSGLSNRDLLTLGADVLPSVIRGGGPLLPIGPGGGTARTPAVPLVRQGPIQATGGLERLIVQRMVRRSFPRVRACYERGLQKNASLQGRITAKLTITKTGAVSQASESGSDLPDKAVVACVVGALRTITFPQADEETSVEYALLFSPAPPGGGGGGSIGRGGIGRFGSLPSFVLTRLHARYGKDTLGADLVFKEATPIVGGREARKDGVLEEGATPSEVNTFQARYAIRHGWPGPVDCEAPKRGVWGGPWPDAGRTGDTIAATKVAYAPRGRIELSKVLARVPESLASPADAPAPVADGAGQDASADDAGAATPQPASKCGCRTPGKGPASSAIGCGLGLLLALSAMARRLR